MSGWSWLVALVALVILAPVLRAIVLVAAGPLLRARAVARLPDAIHLVADEHGAWDCDPNWVPVHAALGTLGYDDTGAFTVAELPGVVVHLLVHPREGVMATCYEHPVAGRWIAMVCEYADGTCSSVTNGQPPAPPRRPGCESTHLAGADAATLHARLLAAQPGKARVPVTAAQAIERFERRWAADVAWRKTRAGLAPEPGAAERRKVA